MYQYRGLVRTSKQKSKDTYNEFKNKFGDVEKFLYKEYVVKNKPLKTIGIETGYSPMYIRKLLMNCGIKIRDRGCSRRGKSFPMAEEQKEKLAKIFSSPEVKRKRSESQKKVWAKLSYEERLKRTYNGNKARNEIILNTKISSIELKVAEQLNELGIRYIQQKCVCNGKYYLDFYIPSLKLVIECNGDYWHNLPGRKQRDKELKEYVESTGRKIIFIWEHEINDEWFCIEDYLYKGGM